MTALATSPSAPSLISGAAGDLGPGVALARRPCCICPPTCETDDTGDTCIDAACGFCLHGCPAGLARPCCIDQPGDVLDPVEVDGLAPIDPGGTEPLFPAPATAAAAPPTDRSAL